MGDGSDGRNEAEDVCGWGSAGQQVHGQPPPPNAHADRCAPLCRHAPACRKPQWLAKARKPLLSTRSYLTPGRSAGEVRRGSRKGRGRRSGGGGPPTTARRRRRRRAAAPAGTGHGPDRGCTPAIALGGGREHAVQGGGVRGGNLKTAATHLLPSFAAAAALPGRPAPMRPPSPACWTPPAGAELRAAGAWLCGLLKRLVWAANARGHCDRRCSLLVPQRPGHAACQLRQAHQQATPTLQPTTIRGARGCVKGLGRPVRR